MDEFAKLMGKLADKLGPATVDAALGAARMEAYSAVMQGVLNLAWAVALVALVYRVFFPQWKEANTADSDMVIVWGIGGVFISLIAATLFVTGMWNLFDPRTWITMVHPDYWIAHKVLHI